MPGGVLSLSGADRETLTEVVWERDADAGTALRRGQRGWQLRCPGRPGTERAFHLADRRTAAGSRARPDLPARPVRDRSGESLATQGDPGTDPRRRDRGRNR